MLNRRFSDHTTIPTRTEYPALPPTPPETPNGRPTRRRRNFITGEWEDAPYESDDGRVTIYASGEPGEIVRARADYARECIGMSLKPEEAIPSRIAAENAAAKKHGTGAVYDSKGRCMTSTRGSQNRELKRRGKVNNDGSYNDWCGR